MLINHNGIELEVIVCFDNTHIEDSYRIKTRRDMRTVLEYIRLRTLSIKPLPVEPMVLRRSLASQIREWRAHNLLYALGIERERTGSVDLNEERPAVRTLYAVLSVLYPYK